MWSQFGQTGNENEAGSYSEISIVGYGMYPEEISVFIRRGSWP